MTDQLPLADRVELLYTAIDDLVRFHGAEPDTLLNMVKEYANYFARFQLGRVSNELKRNSSFSAARAVDDQVELLAILEERP